LAQPVPDVIRGTAADPAIAGGPVVYRSPFANYRPLSEAVVGPWKSINDEVGRIGGWKVYAREAQESAAPVQPPPSPSPGPARQTGGDAQK
jgi:hypothetical protein